MRGLEKKIIFKDVHTDIHTYGHCGLETNSAQSGRVGENTKPKTDTKYLKPNIKTIKQLKLGRCLKVPVLVVKRLI